MTRPPADAQGSARTFDGKDSLSGSEVSHVRLRIQLWVVIKVWRCEVRSFPVEELVDRVGNRYALTVAVAKRARQLKEGAQPFVDIESKSPTTIALHEIAEGHVQLAEVTEDEPEPEKEPAEEVAELLGTTIEEMGEEDEEEAEEPQDEPPETEEEGDEEDENQAEDEEGEMSEDEEAEEPQDEEDQDEADEDDE